MSIEAAVSLSAAWAARSPALLAFGGDSAVELLSATVVLWRFRAHPVQEHAERRASRIAGILLFVLAAYVVAAAALSLLGYSEAKPTYLGIVILIAAAAILPWIAKEKRRFEKALSDRFFAVNEMPKTDVFTGIYLLSHLEHESHKNR